MASHARHARRNARTTPRERVRGRQSPLAPVLVRAGLTLSAAAGVLAAGGGVATAAPRPPAPPQAQPAQAQQEGRPAVSVPSPPSVPSTASSSSSVASSSPTEQGGEVLATELGKAVDGVLRPVKELPLDPLAKTGVDPLDNSLGTQIADFRPVSTEVLTRPLADGGSLDDLPVVGAVVDLLPG